MSIRDAVKAADDLKLEKVECPEWGVDVYVRTISGFERDQFEAASLVRKGKKREVNLVNFRARLVVLTACEEDGTPAFKPEDCDWLGGKAGKPLDRLFAKAQEMNGFTEEDVDELTKN